MRHVVLRSLASGTDSERESVGGGGGREGAEGGRE